MSALRTNPGIAAKTKAHLHFEARENVEAIAAAIESAPEYASVSVEFEKERKNDVLPLASVADIIFVSPRFMLKACKWTGDAPSFLANVAKARMLHPASGGGTLSASAHIICTAGDRGAFGVSIADGNVFHVPAERTGCALDTVGAGDALCGAFLAAFLAGKTFEISLRHAVAVAGKKVLAKWV